MFVTRLMHFITLKTANSTAICRTWFTWCLICIRPTKQSHTVLTFFLRNWLGTWNDLTRQLIISGTAFHYMPVLQFWLDYLACRCRRLTFIADDSRFILLIFIYVIVFFGMYRGYLHTQLDLWWRERHYTYAVGQLEGDGMAWNRLDTWCARTNAPLPPNWI